MAHFGAQPRFEALGDGLARAREGTQANCGGIAQITAYLLPHDEPEVVVSFEPDGIVPLSRGQRCGQHIPPELQAAVIDGARRGYAEAAQAGGLEVWVVSALVHPVDANARVFCACAQRLVRCWLLQR